MALGAYGIKRPSDTLPDDMEVLVHYAPNRDAGNTTEITISKLQANSVLSPQYHNANTGGGSGVDLNNIPSQYRSRFQPSGLVGYRVEYLQLNGEKVHNFYRLVTSSFFCEPVTANLTNPNQVSPRYVYTNKQTNLMFCTLSPTSAPSNNPNAIPFIGQPGQSVIITNTFFNPIVLDIEMVDHDFETLAIALYGNQTKSIDDGVYTLYDLSGNHNIYKQYDLYEVRDSYNDQLYEIRQNRGNNIDFSKSFDELKA